MHARYLLCANCSCQNTLGGSALFLLSAAGVLSSDDAEGFPPGKC